jgi:hypothetical protein
MSNIILGITIATISPVIFIISQTCRGLSKNPLKDCISIKVIQIARLRITLMIIERKYFAFK